LIDGVVVLTFYKGLNFGKDLDEKLSSDNQ